MENQFFHHALKILRDVCIGCSHCMRVCPTEALRVKDGKAVLYEDRCVDCGECFRVCPVNAIIIEQDDFSKIFGYKHRVALVPAVLMGQFPEELSPSEIYSVLLELGFTDVYEVENSVEVLVDEVNAYVSNREHEQPIISSFCPAIIRLIQVKFPSLVDNIMLLRPPLDVSALYCKKQLMDKGIAEDEIGIFYITPCAAKIAAIKSPVGEDRSEVTGVINMDLIYNRVLRTLKQKGVESCVVPEKTSLTERSILWSLTNGEAAHVNGRCMAIDEIHNVIEFLEKIESEEITDIDFLELRACDESCAGGVLAAGNRFLTVEKLRSRAVNIKAEEETLPDPSWKNITEYKEYLSSMLVIQPVKPRSMLKLDENMAKAMKKMERVRRIMCFLPGIDCGTCGAPSCQALAEDIVQGKAAISHCIFIQRNMEQTRKLHPDHAYRIMEKIWGKDRFTKNCNKK